MNETEIENLPDAIRQYIKDARSLMSDWDLQILISELEAILESMYLLEGYKALIIAEMIKLGAEE